MNLDHTQKSSVIFDEQGIVSKLGRGFHFSSPFSKKNLYYLLWSDEYICTPEYVVDRENLSCYLLMNVLAGKMSVTTEGKTFTVKDGQILLMNLRKPHYYTALTNLRVQQYMLDGNALEAYYDFLQEKYGTALVFQKDSKLSSILTEIQKESMTSVPNDHLISALLSEMLCLFAIGSGTGENDPVRQAKYYMTAHYKENISLDDIANSVSLSKYYFSRIFEKGAGCTPWEFLTEIRMRNAMQLLTHGNGSIETVGLDCGFSNAAHFIRSFKSFTGFTPGTFRKYFTDVSMGMEMRRFWEL